MADSLSPEAKVKIACEFLLESPPGELNDVINDVRTLVNNDVALQEGILPAVEKYNMEQLVTVKSPGHNHDVVISKFGHIAGQVYVDPNGAQTFTFDHMRLVTSNPEPYTSENEATRADIDKATNEYVSNHYPAGKYTVFSQPNNCFAIVIVNCKFNPSNFWNGKYRSTWTLTPTGSDQYDLKGTVHVNVHYYEDGNVQQNTFHEFNAIVPNNPVAILKQIKFLESDLQSSLADIYSALAEGTFKSLRRTLPITKTKVDWGKIANYKIGAELNVK